MSLDKETLRKLVELLPALGTFAWSRQTVDRLTLITVGNSDESRCTNKADLLVIDDLGLAAKYFANWKNTSDIRWHSNG
jgi:hypothetical protein